MCDYPVTVHKGGRPPYQIYITYMRNGFGPYQTVFRTQKEAEEWVRSNEIQITKIDMI